MTSHSLLKHLDALHAAACAFPQVLSDSSIAPVESLLEFKDELDQCHALLVEHIEESVTNKKPACTISQAQSDASTEFAHYLWQAVELKQKLDKCRTLLVESIIERVMGPRKRAREDAIMPDGSAAKKKPKLDGEGGKNGWGSQRDHERSGMPVNPAPTDEENPRDGIVSADDEVAM